MRRAVTLAVFLFVAFLVAMITIWNHSVREQPRIVTLGVGDHYELLKGRKIVLVAVEPDTKCDFRLIGCDNNSCVELEQFFLSMIDNGVSPPAEIFILGFKVRLLELQLNDKVAFIEILRI